MGKVLAGLWALTMLWGTTAPAAPLDFDLPAQSNAGSLGFAGGNAPLLGTDLQVSTVTDLNSPTHPNQTLSLTGGALNFMTGGFVGTGSGGDEWDFRGGGSLSLTGAIPALGITDPKTVLLAGSFTGNPSVRGVGANDLKVLGSGLLNLVNPTLASYFGEPINTTYFGGLSSLINTPATPGSAFSTADFLSGHLLTTPVPEPGTILGLGLGLIALALHVRRRGRSRVPIS